MLFTSEIKKTDLFHKLERNLSKQSTKKKTIANPSRVNIGLLTVDCSNCDKNSYDETQFCKQNLTRVFDALIQFAESKFARLLFVNEDTA